MKVCAFQSLEIRIRRDSLDVSFRSLPGIINPDGDTPQPGWLHFK